MRASSSRDRPGAAPRSPTRKAVPGALPRVGSPLRRFLQAPAQAKVDEASRTLELSFSSEQPCDQWFGREVLLHDPDSADLTRLNAGAPLLFNHDQGDVLGVVESAYIDSDRRGYAVVRFGRDERGEWAMQQVSDGVLKNVSFAYLVDEYEQQSDPETGAETFIARRWTALEISIVTVPADPSVGVGRSFTLKDPKIMDPQDLTGEAGNPSRRQRAAAAAAVELERDRVLAIQAACRNYGAQHLERQFIESGASIEEVRSQILDMRTGNSQRPVSRAGRGDGLENPGARGIGLSDDEVRSFSIVRAINAMLTNDWSAAGLERAASRAMEQRYGRPSQGIFVPPEVMQRGQWGQRAPYAVGATGTGGALVETTLAADQFIEVLRNQVVCVQAGATVLSGLQGNVDIPRQITASTAYWTAESGGITESEGTFDKLSLRPKTIGALSNMSRLMLLQGTPAIEMLARQDLIKVLGLGLDLAALSGSGASNQPTGVSNTAGVGSVVMGTNGANVTLDTLVALETSLNSANAPLSARGYVINAKTAATLKNLKSTTGQYLWTDSPPGQRSGTPHTFNGYPVFVSNQARSNLTKGTSNGVCSELFFGSWSDLIIAQWGTLEILVNPYDSTGFTTGDVKVRAMQTVDIGVRHAASFAVCSDALTP